MTTDDPRARPGHTTLRASRRLLRAPLRSRRRRLLRAPFCSGALLECRGHLLLAPAHDDRCLTDEAALRRRRRRLVVVVVELLLVRGSAAAAVRLAAVAASPAPAPTPAPAPAPAAPPHISVDDDDELDYGELLLQRVDMAQQARRRAAARRRSAGVAPSAEATASRRDRRPSRRPSLPCDSAVYGTESACSFTRVLLGF